MRSVSGRRLGFKSSWRKRMGIEPTNPSLARRFIGFEDRGRHQSDARFRYGNYTGIPGTPTRMVTTVVAMEWQRQPSRTPLRLSSLQRCLQTRQRRRGAAQLALPNSEHDPAVPSKSLRRPTIALNVASDLVSPTCTIRLEHASLTRVSVPEAPVDEHQNSFASPREIRPTFDGVLLPTPAANALRSKECEECKFGRRVARGADALHEFTPRESAECGLSTFRATPLVHSGHGAARSNVHRRRAAVGE